MRFWILHIIHLTKLEFAFPLVEQYCWRNWRELKPADRGSFKEIDNQWLLHTVVDRCVWRFGKEFLTNAALGRCNMAIWLDIPAIPVPSTFLLKSASISISHMCTTLTCLTSSPSWWVHFASVLSHLLLTLEHLEFQLWTFSVWWFFINDENKWFHFFIYLFNLALVVWKSSGLPYYHSSSWFTG